VTQSIEFPHIHATIALCPSYRNVFAADASQYLPDGSLCWMFAPRTISGHIFMQRSSTRRDSPTEAYCFLARLGLSLSVLEIGEVAMGSDFNFVDMLLSEVFLVRVFVSIEPSLTVVSLSGESSAGDNNKDFKMLGDFLRLATFFAGLPRNGVVPRFLYLYLFLTKT